ncbi:MAG: heavy-metal-associated domain-containing protein [Lachnospiraceae bacterium]|nr:heavy-metal-associated domain-containing protein [Lachnospiraceae bacterium]
MHCKNCEKRITEAINNIEGLACKVSLEKKEAVVSYEEEPMKEAVIKLLGDMDFLATEI